MYEILFSFSYITGALRLLTQPYTLLYIGEFNTYNYHPTEFCKWYSWTSSRKVKCIIYLAVKWFEVAWTLLLDSKIELVFLGFRSWRVHFFFAILNEIEELKQNWELNAWVSFGTLAYTTFKTYTCFHQLNRESLRFWAPGKFSWSFSESTSSLSTTRTQKMINLLLEVRIPKQGRTRKTANDQLTDKSSRFALIFRNRYR